MTARAAFATQHLLSTLTVIGMLTVDENKRLKELIKLTLPQILAGRKDILELLLNKEMNFTNEQLREHIDSITIAGNDTTALVASYALLLLGTHEEEQDKVYNE